MASDRRSEDLRGLFERAKLQQVVSPVEQMILGRIHVRGPLILFGGAKEVPAALVDVGEEIVKLRRVQRGDHLKNQRARVVELSGFEQCESKIVAAGVVGGVDGTRAFEVRQRRLQLALLHVKRRELIVRLEAVRVSSHNF